MYVLIHRGSHQIGGSLIEVGTACTRLLLDVGTNLPPLDDTPIEDTFMLEGLTCGKPSFDGVFISHHHGDHCGLANRVLPQIPIYTGKETAQILHVIADFTEQKTPKLEPILQDGKTVSLGEIQITPIAVEHSAREAFMFLLQAEGKNLLYTGDYRGGAEIPAKVQTRLNGRPLDVLISEGTNIKRGKLPEGKKGLDEDGICEKVVELANEYDGTIFVLASATNEPRVQTIHRAAAKSGRLACEELFQAAVRNQANERKTQRFMAFYVDEKESPRKFPYFEKFYTQHQLVGAESLARLPQKKIIFVRSTMADFIQRYLSHCKKGLHHVLIYSIWQGYKAQKAEFLNVCRGMGLDIVDLHCSGHATPVELESLIHHLEPKTLIPVHCEAEHRDAFLTMHKNCQMLSDGERWEVL